MAQLVVAGAFLAVALVIWAAFLRPVPTLAATGIVRTKTFAPAGEYVQYQPGVRQGFYTPTVIPTSEHYIIGIEVPGHAELRYAANPVEAAHIDVGQAVELDVQERGLPPFWRRRYVVALKRSE